MVQKEIQLIPSVPNFLTTTTIKLFTLSVTRIKTALSPLSGTFTMTTAIITTTTTTTTTTTAATTISTNITTTTTVISLWGNTLDQTPISLLLFTHRWILLLNLFWIWSDLLHYPYICTKRIQPFETSIKGHGLFCKWSVHIFKSIQIQAQFPYGLHILSLIQDCTNNSILWYKTSAPLLDFKWKCNLIFNIHVY